MPEYALIFAGFAVGLIVDAVEEVANLNDSDIEPTPDFAGALSTDYILGIELKTALQRATEGSATIFWPSS